MRNNKGQFVKGFSGSKETEFKKGKCSGSNNPSWKGGRRKNTQGYILIYSPEHPKATDKPNGKYIYEHRIVAEKKLGRYLEPGEVVHHINGIKHDNRPENIVVCKNNREHLNLHEMPRGINHWNWQGGKSCRNILLVTKQ